MPDQRKPNILVIWGDDIGITNLSCYSDGLMGYRTPNIDRVADEGMRFTDAYGEQSCTAGRSSFITGQSVFRTGLSKVGMPGADVGLQAEDPTIAELLKPLGYATGQFGKNHLGDNNKFLPTVHGFDEFFGNLYHLNAEEEPEQPYWPDPDDFPVFNEHFRPRGVLHSWATDTADDTVDGRYGPVGKQRIEDTGPLTAKRMETIDDEVVAHAGDFIKRQADADTPFFVWFNTTHMHFRTHPKPESVGQAGRWQSPYHDTMIDHDKAVGRAARPARRAGDGRRHDRRLQHRQRAAHELVARRRDDPVPQREEHQLGGRLPRPADGPLARAHRGRLDLATRSSATTTGCRPSSRRPGSPTSSRSCKAGHTAGDMTYKVHIDGFNLLPYLTGEVQEGPRPGFFYFSDDGDLLALRYDNWKVVFMEQRCLGTLQVWAEPFVTLRVPKLFNLRTDPFERADVTSNTYWDWLSTTPSSCWRRRRMVARFLETFGDFPPRQKAASFTIDQALEKMQAAMTAGR